MKYFFILFLPACVLCPPATNCKRTVALRWAESLQLLFNLFSSLRPLSIWAFWWACELDQWEQQEKIRGGGGVLGAEVRSMISRNPQTRVLWLLLWLPLQRLCSLSHCLSGMYVLFNTQRRFLYRPLPCVWIVYPRHEQTTARGPYATR